MNDSEARRRELLRQTRKLYSDSHSVPAVHPRYGHIYHDLYEEDDPIVEQGSFMLRLSIGILCFLCFVWMDYRKVEIADVSSTQIVQQIEKEFQLKDIQEVWKSLP
jgi:hypothetical protein